MKAAMLLVIVVLCSSVVVALEPREGFYVMAHMANNVASADWALSVGANALEIDLQFVNNIPTEFRHGGICDCLCSWIGDDDSMCDYVGCEGKTNAVTLLNYFATKTNLALVMIDSKVDFDDVNAQRLAGYEAAHLISDSLFAVGFPGEVVVSVAKVDHFEYLIAVVNASKSTPYADRFHFTFDGEEKDINENFQYMLQLPTANRIFGTGNSACFPADFESTMRTAESNRKQGVSGLSYIWTMNLEKTMNDYLAIPVGGIMTNYPQRVYNLAVSKGFTLATPSTRIPAATSNNYDTPCQCTYSISGCSITTPAPKYTACKCNFQAVTCASEVAPCKNASSPFCVNPDTSVRSCLEGGGSCGGYSSQDCECKYSFSRNGCSINKASPANTACKCTKTLVTCTGKNVICNNEGSARCAAPDTSKASCLLGGGNCSGY